MFNDHRKDILNRQGIYSGEYPNGRHDDDDDDVSQQLLSSPPTTNLTLSQYPRISRDIKYKYFVFRHLKK
ncbi:hypothetical protein KQX54_001000 [Cotesia glomerata]|uniref:Uncharacterized protein n=1 Tax=Cotesia glomerata TaxID=32391 RepID=A0AAV7IXI8_COTGL|nr:hypothetical protein KQX54_001000 [Cotesia glomerata]